MPVNTVGGTQSQSAVSTQEVVAGGALGKQEFLALLVTQLRNQDPLNPLDDSEFIAQMAQFSTLEATNNLGTLVAQVADTQQRMQVLGLVGHTVGFTDTDGTTQSGKVTGAILTGDAPVLIVGDRQVSLSAVQTVL